MSLTHPRTEKELTAAAVTRFLEFFDGYAQYREDHHSWAVLCADFKWREVSTMDFEKFLVAWVRGRFGKHLHCGQSSEFKQIIQTLMVGRPRLAQWRHDVEADSVFKEFYDFDRTRSQWSMQ